jgi:hypothetical protein
MSKWNKAFFGRKGNRLHYVVCWAGERGAIYGCIHQHATIREALDCLIPNGTNFLRANEEGHYRSLQETEIIEFLRVIQQMPWAKGVCKNLPVPTKDA